MKKLILLAAFSMLFVQTAVWAASDAAKSDALIVTTTFVPGP